MPSYVIWHAGGRKRAGHREDKLLGTLDAADEQDARRLAAERWPGLQLLVQRQRDERPTAPPRHPNHPLF
jgi:hypothetical protein